MKPTTIEPRITRLFDGPLAGACLAFLWRKGLLQMAGSRFERALGLWLHSLGSLIPAGWFSGNDSEPAKLLQLADNQTLAFTFTLPASSYRHLEDLVKLEIEERTPFRPEEVIGGYHVTSAARPEQLSCRVVILPARQLDPTALEGIDGLSLSANMTLPLSADTPRARQKQLLTHRRLALAAVTFFFLLLAAYLPLWLSGSQLEQVRTELDHIQETATEAAALQQKLNKLTAQQTAALNMQAGSRSRLEILAQIGTALDGDMIVETIELKDNILLLGGNSARAADTIGKLRQLDLVQEIDFDSQVALDADGRETFTLRATINREVGYDG